LKEDSRWSDLPAYELGEADGCAAGISEQLRDGAAVFDMLFKVLASSAERLEAAPTAPAPAAAVVQESVEAVFIAESGVYAFRNMRLQTSEAGTYALRFSAAGIPAATATEAIVVDAEDTNSFWYKFRGFLLTLPPMLGAMFLSCANNRGVAMKVRAVGGCSCSSSCSWL
jgi:hypothetical protein